MNLLRWPGDLAVVPLPPGADLPDWAEATSILSVTATASETSLVCAAEAVPTKAVQQGPFAAFSVEGTLDFALTGVLASLLVPLSEAGISRLASLLVPLSEAGISVFTLSTYDTDWVLVPAAEADRTAEEWRRSGHAVAPAPPPSPSGEHE